MTRPARSDVAFAGALVLAVMLEQAVFRETAGIALLNAAGCVALAWRRTAPVASCMVALAFLAGPEFVQASATDAFTAFLAIIVVLFSLTAYAAPHRPLPAAAAAIVLLSAVSIQASMEQGAGLAAYRLVQEALTNTLEHAGPSAAGGYAVRARLPLAREEVPA
jgi:hypothetical protein